VHKNNFDQFDQDYNNQVSAIQLDYKQNKDKVVEFLVDNIFSVAIELPDNIKSKTKPK
jgi:hypothetical protein